MYRQRAYPYWSGAYPAEGRNFRFPEPLPTLNIPGAEIFAPLIATPQVDQVSVINSGGVSQIMTKDNGEPQVPQQFKSRIETLSTPLDTLFPVSEASFNPADMTHEILTLPEDRQPKQKFPVVPALGLAALFFFLRG